MRTRALTFIILCAARTGSSMLRHFLDSHPKICCYGEIMVGATPESWISDGSIKQVLVDTYRAGPQQFLAEFGMYPDEARAIGFKVSYEELLRPEHAWLLEWLRDHREIRVIHLRRENRLKRLISLLTAARIYKLYGRHNIMSEQERPAVRKVVLTPEQCLEDFSVGERRERLFRHYFEDHALLETTYEAIMSDRANVLAGIAKFLEVGPASLRTKTVKINPDDLRDVLENYDALADALRDTPYAKYFEG